MTKACPNCGKTMAPFGEGLWYCVPCKIAGGDEAELTSLFGPLELFKKGKEVKKKMAKKKSINLNNLAKKVTLREKGKISLPIGQIKETMRIVFQELAAIGDSEALKVIHRYLKKK